MDIQWYPGHMTKTRRMMEENQKLIDIVVELLDARIPISSRNPAIDEIFPSKPRLVVLNKSDIADAKITMEWENYFKSKGLAVKAISSTMNKSLNDIFLSCKEILKEKIEHDKKRGLVNRPVKMMVVGIPNVGKSSFINKLSGKKSAQTGDRPGVTKGKQWIRLANSFELLDTPGILWPKFEDVSVGEKLAFTGAIKDEIMDLEDIASRLLLVLKDRYPNSLAERYKMSDFEEMTGYELLTLLGKKRGFVISGGEIDTERAAKILLDEFRGAKLGRISLESPADFV